MRIVTDEDVDEVVALCEGDQRAAIRALLIGQEFLECEIRLLQSQVSRGFASRSAARTAPRGSG
ncbi:hypothetical protein F0357_17905 [Rhizobiales bacterium Sp-1]|uniref:Uncharacterized protein n=2 Tax=Segnochrobactrum spirostomi TaxID=2608987 RepID=A0A6A7Y935_9HYPH|nr:hypothetical protein [Segnochrobactrum spirostomi]